jgi:hypothetical protein
MTRHQHPAIRSVLRSLSPASLAAAAAPYDPGPLLHLQAAQHLREVDPPPRRRHRSSSADALRTECTLAVTSPRLG